MQAIGIIGGMGPFASAELYSRILYLTHAESDNEHLHILIDSNNSIPDRTAAILGNGPSPLPALIESGKRLKNIGAEILALPCFSSHYYIEALREEIGIPVVSMIDETVSYLLRSETCSVALLQTEGLAQSGIFENALRQAGINVILPDSNEMRLIMELIYCGIKANPLSYDISAFKAFCEKTADSGAVFLLGCTELPIAFRRYGLNYPAIDTLSVYAEALILKAGARLKQKRV